MVVEHPPTDPPAMIPAQAEKLLASWAERDREGWTGAAIVYDEDARPCLPNRKEKWRYPTGKEGGILAVRPNEVTERFTGKLIRIGDPHARWEWVGVNRGVSQCLWHLVGMFVDVERKMLVIVGGGYGDGLDDDKLPELRGTERWEIPIAGTPEQIADLAGPIAPTKHVRQSSLEAWAS